MFDTAGAGLRTCSRCKTELSPSALACPACSALVHREALERLAAQAETAAGQGDHAVARAHWQEALALIPARSEQHQLIAARIADHTRRLDGTDPAGPTTAGRSWTGRAMGAAAAVGLVLAGKLKFLLLG